MSKANTNESKEKSLSGSLFFLGIFLMIGLTICGVLIGDGIKKLNTGSTISVKGYAEKDIVSDLAIWSCNVSLVSPSIKDGYDEIKVQTQKVLDYLVKNGFSKDQTKLEILAKTDETEYLQGGGYRHLGYRFTQTFTIQSKDIKKISDIAEKSQELIREDINFNSFAPQYMYTKLDDLKIVMLGEATKDAKVRAEQIAKSGGNKISKIRSAQQGVFQITPLHSTEIYDYGMNDVSSIEKTIKSIVTVTYSME